MTRMWNHFVAELVAALFTWGVLLGGAVLAHGLTFVAGVAWERRRRWRADEVRRAAYDEQLQLTVPMLSAAAPERVDR